MSKTNEHVRKVLRMRLPSGDHVRAMADALGVDATTVYNYRSGARKVGPDEIVAICRYLRMSSDELLGLEECRINWTEVARYLDETTRDVARIAAAAAVLSATSQDVARIAETASALRATVHRAVQVGAKVQRRSRGSKRFASASMKRERSPQRQRLS
jgi:DNA-binding transcriptional regulator YdaS (Cro superfamily)